MLFLLTFIIRLQLAHNFFLASIVLCYLSFPIVTYQLSIVNCPVKAWCSSDFFNAALADRFCW